MIEIEHSRHHDSIVIRVSGTVSRRDVDLAVPEIEQALKLANTPLKLMIRLEDFQGWEVGSLWEDMIFGLQGQGAFGRIAVIGESTLEKWRTMLAAPFAEPELQFFPQESEDAARKWLGMAA